VDWGEGIMTMVARSWNCGGIASARSHETAAVRSAAYALFSKLVDSPRAAEGEELALPPSDLRSVGDCLRSDFPYPVDLSALVAAAESLKEEDAQRLASSYSGLFEVGSEGPPVALREGLAKEREAGVREEVVRFYSFFGYQLEKERRWACDHLSTELEFLHFLAFREAHSANEEERLSSSLAQFDFLVRHINSWYPAVQRGVLRFGIEPYHLALFDVLGDFLEQDRLWQERNFVRGA
jgi:DMSO reductase family type II enzyme chaperone